MRQRDRAILTTSVLLALVAAANFAFVALYLSGAL